MIINIEKESDDLGPLVATGSSVSPRTPVAASMLKGYLPGGDFSDQLPPGFIGLDTESDTLAILFESPERALTYADLVNAVLFGVKKT